MLIDPIQNILNETKHTRDAIIQYLTNLKNDPKYWGKIPLDLRSNTTFQRISISFGQTTHEIIVKDLFIQLKNKIL
jgi:hypothetical protein